MTQPQFPFRAETTPEVVFIARARHYLGREYPTKLRRAVETLPADRIWSRANRESNSVGNLLLHLTGNVRQWLVAGVGQTPDARERAAEFAATEGASASALLANLDAVLQAADGVLANLSPDQLLEPRDIQGRHVTVLDAIFHVVEHFSLHLGQIVYIAKAVTPGSIRFYDDAGGLARPLF